MYTELCSWENLLLAYRKASKGKRGHPNTAAFEFRLEENLLHLQADLLAQTYRPGGYSSFFIHEPKRRLISAAPFRDRVVHHALCNLMEPIFEKSFISDSYANRVGKGTHRAVNRAQEFARQYPYVIRFDLRQFFPSIDHQILLNILKRKISDPQVIWLIQQILSSGEGVLSEEYEMVYFPGDDLLAAVRPRGLPIGNLTSQFWANVYLNGFDHFVKRRLGCRAYLRYVDDFLLFGESKAQLWEWKMAVVDRLQGLRLMVHARACPGSVREGFPFLGFRIWPQIRRVKRGKTLHFARKLRSMAAQYASGKLDYSKMNASIQGWVNHVRYANTIGLRKAMLNKVIFSTWSN